MNDDYPTPAETNAVKRRLAEKMIREEEPSGIKIYFDPRKADVPEHFKNQPAMVLLVGYMLPVPIRGLLLTAGGFSGAFSFNRTPAFCRVPWSAVYAITDVDGEGSGWRDSIPPELAGAADGATPPIEPPAASAAPVVKGDDRAARRALIAKRMEARGWSVIKGGTS